MIDPLSEMALNLVAFNNTAHNGDKNPDRTDDSMDKVHNGTKTHGIASKQ